jgi:regulator of protease activity HflC (stomatin/prohibitin superfamily)
MHSHRNEYALHNSTTRLHSDFLSTTQQVRELRTLDVLTSDGLMVRVKGSVTFRICNPRLAIVNIGDSKKAQPVALGEKKSGKKEAPTGPNSIFATIMQRSNDTLASLLAGTDLLSSAGMGIGNANMASDGAANGGGEKEKTEQRSSPVQQGAAAPAAANGDDATAAAREVNKVISHRFKHSLTHTLRQEWGVELSDMNVIDIQVVDADVRNALAEGVRCNIVAVTERRNAEAKANTVRIHAEGARE